MTLTWTQRTDGIERFWPTDQRDAAARRRCLVGEAMAALGIITSPDWMSDYEDTERQLHAHGAPAEVGVRFDQAVRANDVATAHALCLDVEAALERMEVIAPSPWDDQTWQTARALEDAVALPIERGDNVIPFPGPRDPDEVPF